jgi:hypothetical protein
MEASPAFGAFRDAFVAGDADALANAFTHDASYATNAGMLLSGHDQIREGARWWFTQRPPGAVVALEVEVVDQGTTEALRWELLRYRQSGHVPGHPDAGSIEESGYALAIYLDVDGELKLRSLAVNLHEAAHQ